MSKIDEARKIAERNAEIKSDLLELCALVNNSDIPDEAKEIVAKYFVEK